MDSDDARRFVETMRAMRPRMVVNEVATAEDVKLGFAVKSVCRTYFGLEAEYVGYVNRDEAVRRSLAEPPPARRRRAAQRRRGLPAPHRRGSWPRGSAWRRARRRGRARGASDDQVAERDRPLRAAGRRARRVADEIERAYRMALRHLGGGLARDLLALQRATRPSCCASASSTPSACSRTPSARAAYDRRLGGAQPDERALPLDLDLTFEEPPPRPSCWRRASSSRSPSRRTATPTTARACAATGCSAASSSTRSRASPRSTRPTCASSRTSTSRTCPRRSTCAAS